MTCRGRDELAQVFILPWFKTESLLHIFACSIGLRIRVEDIIPYALVKLIHHSLKVEILSVHDDGCLWWCEMKSLEI